MKDEEIKCNCGAETTGWTTIACCNLCGLPIPNEPFSVNKQMLVNQFERVVKPTLVEEMIKEIDIEIKKYMGTSTHGSCCTCQACKNFYDDCECESIFPLEEFKKRLQGKI